MTDIHSHVIFGFDDGAPDRDVCVQMLELYAAGGVKTICATSHSGAEFMQHSYTEHFAESAELAKSFGITLLPALEYSLPDLLELPGFFLGSGKYLLLDSGNFLIDAALVNKLMPFNADGSSFVWAHPERLHPGNIDAVVEKYALLRNSCCQINASSLLGYFGTEVKHAAWEMLERGIANIIASDAHNPEGVRAFLEVKKLLDDLYPPEIVELWFERNPERILSNLHVERSEVPALNWKQRIRRGLQLWTKSPEAE